MRYIFIGFCLFCHILSAEQKPIAPPASSQTTDTPPQNSDTQAKDVSAPAPAMDSSAPADPLNFDQNKLPPNHSPDSLDTLDYKTLVWKIFIFMGVFILLCFVTLHFFKKLSKTKLFASNNMHHIKILERRPLSSKTVLYLIDLAGKQILVAESQLEVRSLAQIDWNIPAYEKDSPL